MDGTTREQDKIRRMTLLISVMLLLISGVSYFLYQQSYQTRLQVTVTSKRVLPNTVGNMETKKKTDERMRKSDIFLQLYSLGFSWFSPLSAPPALLGKLVGAEPKLPKLISIETVKFNGIYSLKWLIPTTVPFGWFESTCRMT